MTKNNSKNEIEITQVDLKAIFADKYSDFQKKIIPNCFCINCVETKGREVGFASMIVNYRIYINNLDDVILKGLCAICGKPVGRYVETGELEETARRVRNIKKNYDSK